MSVGGKNIELLAIDANCIIQAIIRGKAAVIFRKLESTTYFHVPLPMMEEVLEHIPGLALKRGLALEDALTALHTLPLQVHEHGFYKETYEEAWKRIHEKDEDDTPLLALALKLNCPIWTNNLKHFKDCGAVLYTTADFVKKFDLG